MQQNLHNQQDSPTVLPSIPGQVYHYYYKFSKWLSSHDQFLIVAVATIGIIILLALLLTCILTKKQCKTKSEITTVTVTLPSGNTCTPINITRVM